MNPQALQNTIYGYLDKNLHSLQVDPNAQKDFPSEINKEITVSAGLIRSAVSGWSVNADGTAEFSSVTITGGTIAGVNFGSILYDTDNTYDIGTSSKKADDVWCRELHYNTLTAISDSRFKRDISTLNYGLAAIEKLKPCSFVRIETGATEYGFIAQEVREAIPEIVKGFDFGGEERLSIDVGALVPVLVRAVQELSREVKELGAIINK